MADERKARLAEFAKTAARANAAHEAKQAAASTKAPKAVGRRKAAPKADAGDVEATGALTTIHLPKELLERLRIMAVKRASRQGGRPSVSAILTLLAERHLAELEAEL